MKIIEISEKKLNQIVNRIVMEQMTQQPTDKTVQDFFNFLTSSGFEKTKDDMFKFSDYLPGRNALVKVMNVNGTNKVEVIDSNSQKVLYKFNSLSDAKNGLSKMMDADN